MTKKMFLIILLTFIFLALSLLFLLKDNTKTEFTIEKTESGIGILVCQNNINNAKKYERFAKYLNDHTNNNWKIIPIKDCSSFLKHIETGNIEIGFVDSAIGYKLIKEKMATSLVKSETDGSSTYEGYIFARKDNKIKTMEDLKGKKFAYVFTCNATGYSFPYYLIDKKGYNPHEYFKVSSFLKTDEKTILSVFNNEFDAGATNDIAWKITMEKYPFIENEMTIIEKIGPFPRHALAASNNITEEKKKELQKLLLNMNETEEGRNCLLEIGIDKFIATSEKDFKIVKQITNF